MWESVKHFFNDTFKYWIKNHDFQWKYKLEVCLPLFVFLVAIDWATKIAVQFTMHQGDLKDVMPGFMQVGYIINPGSAYGANAGSVGGSIAIASVITIITAVIIVFLNDRMWLIAIIFIFSGSFANLIARSWAPAVATVYSDGTTPDYPGVKGGVIDFMQWGFSTFNADSYIFNVADLEVTLGVILLVVFAIVEVVMFFVNANRVKKGLEVIEVGRRAVKAAHVTHKATKRALKDKEESDDSEYDTNHPRNSETREEYDTEVKLDKKQTKQKNKEEKVRRNNMTDRKATMYEQERVQRIDDDIQARELSAKELKAQKKLEKMKKHEHKDN